VPLYSAYFHRMGFTEAFYSLSLTVFSCTSLSCARLTMTLWLFHIMLNLLFLFYFDSSCVYTRGYERSRFSAAFFIASFQFQI
jgi:hypothetical protein